jgi:hypothetical protein
MQTHYDHQVGRFEGPRALDSWDVLMARARRARAEAMTEMFGALLRRVTSTARRAIGSVRSARRAAGLMPTRELQTRTPLRLTGGCD